MDQYIEDQDLAVRDLGSAVYDGCVDMLVGAGISFDAGLPGWVGLIEACLKDLKGGDQVVDPKSTFDQLISKASLVLKEVGDAQSLRDLIRHHLYKDINKDYFKKPYPLLCAIGALLMGSRRGCVRDVWSLNYDDVLCEYLSWYGYVAQVVTELPVLSRDVDVTMYYPHGFIVRPESSLHDSETLVFDEESYAKRSFSGSEKWREKFRSAIESKVFMVIGSSNTDRLVSGLFTEVATRVKDRPLGFWLTADPDFDEEKISRFKRMGMVPLRCASHEEYPELITQIVRGNVLSAVQ